MTDFKEVFYKLLQEESDKTGVPYTEFRSGGRATKEWPAKENHEWWEANGPAMVERWVNFRNNSGWVFWEPTPGTPAIELGMNVVVGPNKVGVKMFLDRVMVTPEGELIIIDLKTGSRTPESDLQLAFYAYGLGKTFGVRPQLGAYWMARTGTTSDFVNLDNYPDEMLEMIITKFDEAIRHEIFLPNFSHCKMCSVIQFCSYKNGFKEVL